MRIRDVEGAAKKIGEYFVCEILHMAKICIWQQNIKTCKQDYEGAKEHC